jgi:hypothetical protein
MKRLVCLSTVVLLGMAASAWGAGFACLNHGIHCICPPAPPCPDCSCPCDTGHHHCSAWKSAHAQRLIEQLNSECCCERIRACEKLGSRLHADYCCDPEVLTALIHALQCDSCWEVRRAAAWAIAYQRARTEVAVLSLYLASKLDPHFLVRDGATDALSILIVCRRECYKELFAQADALAKALKPRYRPGKDGCVEIMEACMSACHVAVPAPVPAAGKPAAQAMPAGPAVVDGNAVLMVPPSTAQAK